LRKIKRVLVGYYRLAGFLKADIRGTDGLSLRTSGVRQEILDTSFRSGDKFRMTGRLELVKEV
jgi:hypothetical protein